MCTRQFLVAARLDVGRFGCRCRRGSLLRGFRAFYCCSLLCLLLCIQVRGLGERLLVLAPFVLEVRTCIIYSLIRTINPFGDFLLFMLVNPLLSPASLGSLMRRVIGILLCFFYFLRVHRAACLARRRCARLLDPRHLTVRNTHMALRRLRAFLRAGLRAACPALVLCLRLAMMLCLQARNSNPPQGD